MVITTNSLSCIGEAVSPFHYVFYCTAVEEGDVGDDWSKVLDVELYKLGLKYMRIFLENIGSHSLDYEVRSIIGTGREKVEVSDYIEANDLAEIEVMDFPWTLRIYVKNTTPGQTTKYKITVLATK